jgi:hypothetical protein
MSRTPEGRAGEGVRADRSERAARPQGAGDDPREMSNTIKDPEEWTTGDEPMTGAQRSYLHTLASEAKEEVPDGLTKAEASRLIDELQQRTGRGVEGAQERGPSGR